MESIKISKIVSCGFGSGLSPIAPGTTGSIGAIAAWFLLPPEVSVWALVAISLGGLWAIHQELKINPENQDPGYIVIDEWAGMFLPLLYCEHNDPFSVLIAFLLFRFFDVIKPYPVSRADNMHGALGVMLDDIFAGGYALSFLIVIQMVLLEIH